MRPSRFPRRGGDGYAYLKTGRYSLIADGVQGFLQKNPGLIGMKKRGA